MDSMAKVILITGASSGIGQACAAHLAARGHRVFGTSRRAELQGKKETAHGYLEIIQMDVNEDDSVARGIKYVVEKEGRLDVVLNNAGFGIAGAIEDTSIEEAKAQFETNLFGVLRVCRAVLPIMRAQRAGYIVNIGSLGGRVGLPFVGLYHASKFAVDGMTEALRMETRPFGIHVVLIEPGDCHTQFTARRHLTRGAQQDSAYASSCHNVLRVIEEDELNGSSPQVVARVLERIINDPSPRSRYMTGSTFEKVAVTLKKIIPAQLFEWAVMKRYKVL